MRRNILISLLIVLVVLVSCEEKDMKWINAQDPQADSAAITEICEQNNAECGYVRVKFDDGKLHAIFCGDCETGYRCSNDSNKCYDINECSRPELNDCNNEVSTCANEEGTYSCICKENYSGDDCVPDTRTRECENLPENAEWNTASSITQTWNGTSWEPSTIGIYSEEESTNECRFKCKANYFWNGSQCVNPCNFNPCNNVTNSTEICTALTATDYSCGCETHYTWNNSTLQCEADKQKANCTDLPENAEWNTASSITQTWNGEEWEPSTIGIYSEEESTDECRFKCDTNYFWHESQCITPCDPNPCIDLENSTEICIAIDEANYSCGCNEHYNWNTSTKKCNPATQTFFCANKPENSSWNSVSSYIQTWDGTDWTPSATATTYNEIAATTECRFKCNSGYKWNGFKCLKLGNIGNICTGQDKCYDNEKEIECPDLNEDFFGQDSQYAALGICVKQSFSINEAVENEKTVMDNNLELEWQQTIPSEYYTWSAATNYCNELTYAGKNDWRLPTLFELLSLIDAGKRTGSVVNSTYFPDSSFNNTFWSSSDSVNNKDYAKTVDLSIGDTEGDDKTSHNTVVCVRGNTPPLSSFSTKTINEEIVVTDSITGLMWQKTYKTRINWPTALKYCEELNYAGYNDWRLPNRNELLSLVNYNRYNPASNFPDIPENIWLWSSSSFVRQLDSAWRVEFYYGHIYYHYKSNNNVSYETSGVRCVRSDQ